MRSKLWNSVFKKSCVVIAYQIAVMPIGFSATQDESRMNKTAEVISQMAGVANTMAGAYQQQAMMQGAGTSGIDMYKAQLSPALKLQPVDPSQIPPVFAGCMVLPAKGNELSSGMQCTAANQNQLQGGYAAAMIEIAEYNKQQLSNFQVKGHERFTTQGIGCYEKKIEDFEGLLKTREEELNKFQKSLKERIEAFKLAAKGDLENIKAMNAMLTGSPAKYLKDVKFEDIFLGQANDPNNVCRSNFGSSELKKAGKGGLRAIEEAIFNKTNPSSGYSADKLLSDSVSIERDINKLSDLLSRTTQKRGNLEADLNSITFRSKTFSKSNKALAAVVNDYNTTIKQDLETLKSELKIDQAMAGDGTAASILGGIEKGNINLEERLSAYEIDSKKACLNKLITSNFSSASGMVSRFRDPSVSKSKSRSADNSFGNYIASELMTDDSIENILARIKAKESKGINSRYIMQTGKSFTVNGREINASTALRPSQIIGIFTDNCIKEYKVKRNADGVSKSELVANLRTYGQKLSTMRKTAATKLKTQIREQLKTCSSDSTTGVSSMSCDGAMKPDSPNFCLRTARLCASNLKGCYAKAQERTKQFRESQVAVADKYNTQVAELKKGMQDELKLVNTFMEGQARMLDAQLNVGTVFKTPDLEFDLTQDFAMKGEGIDDSLNLEDPDKLLQMAEKQIAGLTKELKKQQAEQVAKLNTMKTNYVSRYAAEEQRWASVIQDCNKAIGEFNKSIAKQNEEIAKRNEELGKRCNELLAFSDNPESGIASDLASDLSKVSQLAATGPQGAGAFSASDKNTLAKIRSFSGACQSTSDADGMIMPGTKKSGHLTSSSFCESDEAKNMFPGAEKACENRNKVCDSDSDFISQVDEILKDKAICPLSSSRFEVKEECVNNKFLDGSDFVSKYKGIRNLFPQADFCIPPSQATDDELDAKDLVAQMVAGYNCSKDKSAMGELRLTACNGRMNGSGAGKDSLENILHQAGDAAARSLAVQQDG